MKVLACLAVVAVLSLLGGPPAVAQQSAQPVVRMGNWIEVGNELFMHIIGSIDANYRTTQNYDFESRVRDRVNSRTVTSSTNHEGSADIHYAEVRLGADFRYQKSLLAQVLFEQQITMDASTVDAGNLNSNNPGGTDIFGRSAPSENAVVHLERYWIDYRFAGTPLRMRVGSDLWRLDQAAMVNDDDPRFAVFADFGNLELTAAVAIERESQRVGLTNDNDLIYYMFSAGYDLKPHRIQFDVVYARDRFSGADVSTGDGGADGFRGQRTDGVNVSLSWSGKAGPLLGLVQGMVSTGTARGGTGFGLSPGVAGSRDYDILGFGAIVKLEADLGIIRPFIGAMFATGDGDPTDNKLHGFNHLAFRSSGTGVSSSIFQALETSPASGGHRDYFCPGGMTGANNSIRPGGNANLAIGNSVFAGVTECGHTIDNPFNDRIGGDSHPGISTVYSNPGGLLIPVGVRVFPLKGHELRAFYVYKQFIKTQLLEIAYNLPRGSISKEQVHEIGAAWQWTLNPHFDIRLSGTAGFAGAGYKDLANLADCNATVGGVQPCEADDVALQGHARFRARF
ncbi:MAG: hypothetical protein AB7N91_01755 [Candidatus Tectimicrobiota bacterium]